MIRQSFALLSQGPAGATIGGAVLSIYDYAFVLPFGALRHFDGHPDFAVGIPGCWLLVVMDVSQMGSRRSSHHWCCGWHLEEPV
jgi:hypothetical protein